MIEIVGVYNTAVYYTDSLEETAAAQIKAVCDQSAFAACKIRIGITDRQYLHGNLRPTAGKELRQDQAAKTDANMGSIHRQDLCIDHLERVGFQFVYRTHPDDMPNISYGMDNFNCV